MRVLLWVVGTLAVLYGAWRLLELGWANLVATAIWLVVGVAVHDGLLGPLLIAGGAVVALVPSRVRAPVAAGLVVLGTVTMTAVPVLGRFGARPDNPTLLDRDYTVGWLVLAALVAAAAASAAARTARRRRGSDDGDVVREPHDEIGGE